MEHCLYAGFLVMELNQFAQCRYTIRAELLQVNINCVDQLHKIILQVKCNRSERTVQKNG